MLVAWLTIRAAIDAVDGHALTPAKPRGAVSFVQRHVESAEERGIALQRYPLWSGSTRAP